MQELNIVKVHNYGGRISYKGVVHVLREPFLVLSCLDKYAYDLMNYYEKNNHEGSHSREKEGNEHRE